MMLLPAVTPAQGTELANAIRVLRDTLSKLSSLNSSSAEEHLNSYHAWASEASGYLRSAFDLVDVEWLLNTKRHDFLIAKPWADNQLLINNMISAEQQDRTQTFKAVVDGLERAQSAAAKMPKSLLVPDTNFFLHQEAYFDELNWPKLSNRNEKVRVMVPMAVVRELDKAKRAQQGKKVSDTNTETVRSRARQTSKRLRDLFEYGDETKELRWDTTIEVLLDPVGHRHLEDPDSEIVERAASLQSVSGKPVHIVTGDGNMQFMARVAGLKVVALPD